MSIINPISRLSNDLDFTFKADSVNITSLEQFDKELLSYSTKSNVFLRGERFQSVSRPLLPTIFRNRDLFFKDGKKAVLVDSETIYNYYQSNTAYFELYENIIGIVDKSNMYPFLAFSQHYFGVSPLIDFTKSIDVALSFALKDRIEYKKDIIIYTIEIKNQNDYTNNVDLANKWINDYGIVLFNNSISRFDIESNDMAEIKAITSAIKGKSFIDVTSPSAKLIDVPMNDLMRYQQGVFLLLDDFSLIGNSYLTKRIRDDFVIKKWVISKSVCPELLSKLLSEKPYYAYKNITDLNKVVAEIKKRSGF